MGLSRTWTIEVEDPEDPGSRVEALNLAAEDAANMVPALERLGGTLVITTDRTEGQEIFEGSKALEHKVDRFIFRWTSPSGAVKKAQNGSGAVEELIEGLDEPELAGLSQGAEQGE